MKSWFLSSRLAVGLVFLLVCGTAFGQTKPAVKPAYWERERYSWVSDNICVRTNFSDTKHSETFSDKLRTFCNKTENNNTMGLGKYGLLVNKALSSRSPVSRYAGGIGAILLIGIYVKKHPVFTGCIVLTAVIYGLIQLAARQFKNSKAKTGS